MQLNGKKPTPSATLMDLRRGEQGTIHDLHLPADVNQRLMELGFLPGASIRAGRTAPGGGPRVFEVDGSEVALRGETARLIRIERG